MPTIVAGTNMQESASHRRSEPLAHARGSEEGKCLQHITEPRPSGSGITRRSLLLCSGVGLLTAQERARLSRTNLLEYRADDGSVRPVTSVRSWLRRRSDILRSMQEIMGPLPGKEKRCPLDLRVEEETDAGSYLRRLITYAA